jgi:1,4-dihydroxy-2-naphthoyl-CoA hydrolase
MTAPIWQPGTTLEGCNAISERSLAMHLGIVITELGPDFIRGTMPVNARSVQPMRILHGGASVALAETLASIGASCVVDRRTQAVVGQEINANHLRPVPEGETVEGTARPFHLGSRSQVWGIEIVDAQRRLVCVSRITLAVIARP